MKAIAALSLLTLAACHKPDVEVRYGATCDKCRVEYIATDGKTVSVTVDSYRYDDQGVKVLETFLAGATMKHDDTPRITLYRDSGYAFVSLKADLDTQTKRVFGDVETLSH